jgi:hypothetical protein
MAKTASTRLKDTVAECQARATASADRLRKTLSFVPDNKLKWSPSKTARTPLAIVAHCCLTNRMLAKVLRGEPMSPMPKPEEIRALSQKFEATIRNRAQAVRQLKASCEEVVAALATLTTERFAASPISPFGPLPMAVWVNLPSMHMGNHASQIDYLQTIWGDLADHM